MASNRSVVITGGSRGIGRSCCLEFAKSGADVVFTYYKSKDEAEQLVVELKKIGAKCFAFQVDVGDYNQCQQFAIKFLDKFPKIDILINNAGIIKDKALFMMQPEDWLNVINVNLNGMFNITRNFITTFMKQKQGSIINISSLSGVIGLPRQTNYAASKGGVIAFTKSLAKEVAAFNVKVNCIAPGFIETDMLKDLKREYLDKAIGQIPLKRFGSAQEVAKVALFLASQEADYITGEVIQVDGGLGM